MSLYIQSINVFVYLSVSLSVCLSSMQCSRFFLCLVFPKKVFPKKAMGGRRSLYLFPCRTCILTKRHGSLYNALYSSIKFPLFLFGILILSLDNSLYFSIRFFIFLCRIPDISLYISFYVSIHSIHQCVRLSVRFSVCLSVCLSSMQCSRFFLCLGASLSKKTTGGKRCALPPTPLQLFFIIISLHLFLLLLIQLCTCTLYTCLLLLTWLLFVYLSICLSPHQTPR